MTSLIWAIIVVLFVLWLLGFGLHIGGGLIFLLLLVAVALVVYNLLAGGVWAGSRPHRHVTEVTEVERTDV